MLSAIPVEKGEQDSVDVGVLEKTGLVRAKQDQAELSIQYQLPTALKAPLKAGDIGHDKADIWQADKLVASYDLAILQDVKNAVGLLN